MHFRVELIPAFIVFGKVEFAGNDAPYELLQVVVRLTYYRVVLRIYLRKIEYDSRDIACVDRACFVSCDAVGRIGRVKFEYVGQAENFNREFLCNAVFKRVDERFIGIVSDGRFAVHITPVSVLEVYRLTRDIPCCRPGTSVVKLVALLVAPREILVGKRKRSFERSACVYAARIAFLDVSHQVCDCGRRVILVVADENFVNAVRFSVIDDFRVGVDVGTL